MLCILNRWLTCYRNSGNNLNRIAAEDACTLKLWKAISNNLTCLFICTIVMVKMGSQFWSKQDTVVEVEGTFCHGLVIKQMKNNCNTEQSTVNVIVLSWTLVETYHVVKEIIIHRWCDIVELVLIVEHKIEKESPDFTDNEICRGALHYSRSSSWRASQWIIVFETQTQFWAFEIEFNN